MINKRFYYNYKTLILFYSLLFSASSPVFAIIGLPENTTRFGTALGISEVSVTEPDGKNPDKEQMIPLTLIATDWLSFGNRYWLEYVNGKAAYKASEVIVGQNVHYSALRAIIQRHLNISKQIKPWFGIGLVISRTTFETRHTQADDGFLIQKFDDRTSHSLGLILNTTIDFNIEKNWYVGFKAEQTFNPDVSVNTRGAGLFILYLYP